MLKIKHCFIFFLSSGNHKKNTNEKNKIHSVWIGGNPCKRETKQLKPGRTGNPNPVVHMEKQFFL